MRGLRCVDVSRIEFCGRGVEGREEDAHTSFPRLIFNSSKKRDKVKFLFVQKEARVLRLSVPGWIDSPPIIYHNNTHTHPHTYIYIHTKVTFNKRKAKYNSNHEMVRKRKEKGIMESVMIFSVCEVRVSDERLFLEDRHCRCFGNSLLQSRAGNSGR